MGANSLVEHQHLHRRGRLVVGPGQLEAAPPLPPALAGRYAAEYPVYPARRAEMAARIAAARSDLLRDKQVVDRISSALRESDTLARLGGDEFTVILPDTDGEQALQVAGKIITVGLFEKIRAWREAFGDPEMPEE